MRRRAERRGAAAAAAAVGAMITGHFIPHWKTEREGETEREETESAAAPPVGSALRKPCRRSAGAGRAPLARSPDRIS